MRTERSSFPTGDTRKELVEAVGRGVRWLLEPGVREGSSSGFLSGGFRAQSPNGRTNDCPVYSEITGYGSQFFLWLYRETGIGKYLDTAVDAADFLLRVQCGDELPECEGAFPYGVNTSTERVIEQYFVFDSGICASALVDAYRETGEKKYLRSAVECGKWLLGVQRDDGSFPALLSPLPQEEWTKAVCSWYGDGSAIHGKLAITFLKLWQETTDAAFHRATVRLLTWLSTLQSIYGYFRASESVSDVVTHAHCYAVEGLLYASEKTENSSFASMARRGSKRLLEMQNEDGSYCKFYLCKGGPVRESERLSIPFLRRFVRPLDTGATAQASRIMLCGNGRRQQDDRAIERSTRFLLAMQSGKGRGGVLGGFHARSDKVLCFRRVVPEYYPWTSMFAIQFLIAVLRSAPRLATQEIF